MNRSIRCRYVDTMYWRTASSSASIHLAVPAGNVGSILKGVMTSIDRPKRRRDVGDMEVSRLAGEKSSFRTAQPAPSGDPHEKTVPADEDEADVDLDRRLLVVVSPALLLVGAEDDAVVVTVLAAYVYRP